MRDGSRWHWRQLHWLWLTLLVVGFDQWTKALIQAAFQFHETRPVLPFFNLVLTYNEGAAFSFLADAGGWQRWFFAGVAALASVVILGWLLRGRETRITSCGLALILGGALGNLWDRLVLGHVVDFLDFYWQARHFPAFNLADAAITVGAALLILDMLRGGRREHE